MFWRSEILRAPDGTEGAESAAPAEGATSPAEPSEKSSEPWYEARIRQLTAGKKAAEEQLAAATKVAPTAPDAPQIAALTQRDIEARAAQIAAEKEFNSTCDTIWNTGKEEFGDFQSKIENFKKLGGLSPEMIQAADETGIAHKVLHELGSNMDEAARVMSLPPVKMAVAIAKLGEKLAKVKPTSSAPDPVPPISGRRSAAPDSSEPDNMDIDKWMKWRDKQVQERGR